MSDEQTDLTQYDTTELVERTDTGVSITSEIKRGSGTRDQDKHVVKSKGHTVEEAIQKHEVGLRYLEQRVAPRVRDVQPEVDEDD